MKILTSLTLLLVLLSCAVPNKVNKGTMNKQPDSRGSIEKSKIISAPVVMHQNTIKGELQETGDYYIQRSIQDYFIKFCESEITKKELEEYLTNQKSSIKVLKAEVEFKNGEWDSCDDEAKVASRTGDYVIIHRIID